MNLLTHLCKIWLVSGIIGSNGYWFTMVSATGAHPQSKGTNITGDTLEPAFLLWFPPWERIVPFFLREMHQPDQRTEFLILQAIRNRTATLAIGLIPYGCDSCTIAQPGYHNAEFD